MTGDLQRIECKRVEKSFTGPDGRVVKALRALDVTIKDGEFVCVVGSSGSGKSTLLRLFAGLDEPSSGSVMMDRKQGRVGLLFQTNSVFPWRTVEQNLGYFLEAKGAPAEERRKPVEDLCRSVGLNPEEFLKRYPQGLSGGEARRVAIGMVLSSQPTILLLDEPTSQLDYASRRQIQTLLHTLWEERKTTVICVTHDIDEALTLAQRIVVLKDGELIDSLEVDLPFPRNAGTLALKPAVDARVRLVNCLEQVHA